MSNYVNVYIDHVKNYVEQNTPIQFMLDYDKFTLISEKIENLIQDSNERDLVIACYSLLYTTFHYHLLLEDNEIKPYNILAGDYISSYISEILYKHKLYAILNIFVLNAKKISIGYINQVDDDHLIDDIINYYKG